MKTMSSSYSNSLTKAWFVTTYSTNVIAYCHEQNYGLLIYLVTGDSLEQIRAGPLCIRLREVGLFINTQISWKREKEGSYDPITSCHFQLLITINFAREKCNKALYTAET